MKFLRCPECKKRGVHHKLKSHGEDNFACRYCDWYAFTVQPGAEDKARLAALKNENPDAEALGYAL